MFYMPNYCCNCGEKIERVDWNILTNRRFCEVCETEHQLDDWLKRIFPAIVFLVGLFGVGGYMQNSEDTLNVSKSDTFQENIDKKNSANPRTLKSNNSENIKPSENSKEVLTNKDLAKPQKLPLKENVSEIEKPERPVIAKSPQKNKTESVYFCGAETKKGTPCSRRVKGGGRCWQHIGKDALLPTQELLIGNK